MGSERPSSSLSCELRILKAKNVEVKPSGAVFVRCYISAGNNRKVRLDSQEIRSNSDVITWDQTFSLDCLGSSSSIEWLKRETLVFELRWRSCTSASFIGRIRGSKLIGRAEVPWNDVVDSADMEIEKWVPMAARKGGACDDVIDPAALRVAVKILEPGLSKKVNEGRWGEGCGCMDGGCNSCLGCEFFAIEASLEAL